MRKLRERGIEDAFGRDIDADLFKAIRTSLEHLGYHTPVISDTALKSNVMGLLAGRVTLGRIEGVLKQMERDGHLYRSKKPGSRSAWVTREALAAERGVIRYMVEGRGAAKAIRPDFDPANEIMGQGLTLGQMGAINSVLTSCDRVSGVQGYAGTGKTTMLKTLADKAGGKKFIGLAPTVGASVLLGAEAGIPSRTLQNFLARHQDIEKQDKSELEALRKEHWNTVLVVDEASMIGTRQMESLFGITDRLGIERVVLVGDSKQLRSIEAGQSFRQLQQHGMNTAVMEDIVRQKGEGLKIPVEMMLTGNITCAIERLGDKDNDSGRLVEVKRENLHRSAAGLYLQLSDSDQRDTIIMAQTNYDRQAINEEIRDGLAEDGRLGATGYEGERLVNRHMTPTEKADALNYELGDVLVYHSRYQSETGEDHYTVTDIGRDGRLHIESASGHRRDFDPSRGKASFRYEVFEVDDISLREKDLIRFTRNDPDLRGRGVINGAEATVENIGPESITLCMAGDGPRGKNDRIELSRDHNALKHLDHGYCRTTYSAQGRTSKRVIAVADSGLGHLADQQNFYVQISRASDEAVVVTDDILKLTDNLEQNTGERLTAMEAVGDSGWGIDQDKNIELPAHEVDTEERNAEIGRQEIDLQRHFPPELTAMLNNAREIANIKNELEREAAKTIPPSDSNVAEMEQSTPTIEGKGMERGEAVETIKPKPERENTAEPEIPPEVEPEAMTLEELAAQLKQRIDDTRVGKPERGADPKDGVPGADEIPVADEPAIGEIGNGVIQVPREELTKEAARCWLNLPEDVREKTGILATPGYQSSLERHIRSELAKQGRLQGPSIDVDRLSLVPLSEEEKGDARNYSRGDMVLMKKDDPRNGIKADSWVKVLDYTTDEIGTYRLQVESKSSTGIATTHEVGMDKLENCQVFKQRTMELRGGDRIRWRRGSDKHGIVATQKADVTKIDGNMIHMRMQDGRETKLAADSKLFEACDYAFNLTTWEFDRGAVENVIAVTKSYGPDLGIVDKIVKEFDKNAGNAVLVTNDFNHMNLQLKKNGQKSLDVRDGIRGLLAVKGGTEKRHERRRGNSRSIGMRM